MVTYLDTVDRSELDRICRRWNIVRLEAFGSVLTNSFGDQSDIDLLVTFAPTSQATLFDLDAVQAELSSLLRRRVDLVTRRSIEGSKNYLRRRAILDSAAPIYALSASPVAS